MRQEGMCVWPEEEGHIFQSSGSCLAPRHETQPSGAEGAGAMWTTCG